MIYPGAWTIGKIGKWKTHIDTPSHISFASAYHHVNGEHGPETIDGSAETIRLIAAAPELLDLVKRALLSHGDSTTLGDTVKVNEWVADARGVINKIERNRGK